MRRVASIEFKRFAWCAFGDEVAVADLARRTVHTLNPTGALLWQTIADAGPEGVSDETLVTKLVEAYEVDASVARTHVAAFVDALVEQGLLGTLEDQVADQSERRRSA